nr:unnamed protein product [Callosobruchus chinensis]
MSSFGYVSYINKYTRPSTKTCIDHFYVKGDQELSKIHAFVINYKITDHCPILISFSSANRHRNENKTSYVFKKYINYYQLKADVKNHFWHEVFHPQDVNIATSNFVQKLQFFIQKNTQTVRKTRRKDPLKPWITKAILRCINKKNQLYQEHLKQPQNIDMKNSYVDYKNQLEKDIKKAKKSYTKTLIDKNKSHTSALWQSVKQICNQSQKTSINKIILEDSKTLTDPIEISNHFNTFFGNIGQKLSNQINVPLNYNEYTHWNQNSINYFRRTSFCEVQKVIKELKSKKSPGYDNIRAETLKEISMEIAPILVYLINFSFSVGCFPDCLKMGKIKPLFKEGTEYDVNNYRPISLISNLAKIFEKIIKARMIKFLEDGKLLSAKQFGFRQGKSTEDAILNLCDQMYEAVDKNQASLCVFIDLQKAFDTVSHDKLMKKLREIGFRGSALNLLKSYLENRQQFVEIDGTNGNLRTVAWGVPQGTVMGPILFIIYVNNLLKTNFEGNLASFADDTVAFYSGEDWNSVKSKAEKDLSDITKWLEFNKLTLNITKTKFMTLTSNKYSTPNFEQLNVGPDVTINKTAKIKYLGIIIDSHLRWDEHIRYIVRKTRYLVTRFAYLKTYLHVKQLKTVYYALFQSQLNYGLVGWGGVRDCHLSVLEILQKWVIKVIFNKEKLYPTNQLYNESNIFDIRQLYFIKILSLVNKRKIDLHTIAHPQNTRQQQSYVLIPLMKKEIGHKCFKYLTAKFFNYLPSYLRASIHEKTFVTQLKTWIHTKDRQDIRNLYKNDF